jgi:uncharacterized protein YcfJ
MATRRKKKEKKLNFVDDIDSDIAIYKKGAFIGGLIGGVTGLIWGRKIILGIVIGGLSGGYISYKINQDDSELKKFKTKS